MMNALTSLISNDFNPVSEASMAACLANNSVVSFAVSDAVVDMVTPNADTDEYYKALPKGFTWTSLTLRERVMVIVAFYYPVPYRWNTDDKAIYSGERDMFVDRIVDRK